MKKASTNKFYVYTFAEGDTGRWFHYEENAKAYAEELKAAGNAPMLESAVLDPRERFNTRFWDRLEEKQDAFLEPISVPFNVIPF